MKSRNIVCLAVLSLLNMMRIFGQCPGADKWIAESNSTSPTTDVQGCKFCATYFVYKCACDNETHTKEQADNAAVALNAAVDTYNNWCKNYRNGSMLCGNLTKVSIGSCKYGKGANGGSGSSVGSGIDGGQNGSGGTRDKYANTKVFNENNNFDFGDHTPTGSAVGDVLQGAKNNVENQIVNSSINNITHDANQDLQGTFIQDAAGKIQDLSKPIDIVNDNFGDMAGKLGFSAFKAGLSAYSAEQKKKDAEDQQRQKVENQRKQREKLILTQKRDFYQKQAIKIQSLFYNAVNPQEENYYKQCYQNNLNCYANVTVDSDCNPSGGVNKPDHEVNTDNLAEVYLFFKKKLQLFGQIDVKTKSSETSEPNATITESGTITESDFDVLNKSLISIILEVRKQYPKQQLSYYMGYEYYLARNPNPISAYTELRNTLVLIESGFNSEYSPNLAAKVKEKALSEVSNKKQVVKDKIISILNSEIPPDDPTTLKALQAKNILKDFNTNNLADFALERNAIKCLSLLTSNFSETKPGFTKSLINSSVAKNKSFMLEQYFQSSNENRNKVNAETQNGKSLASRAIKEKKDAILYFCEKYQGINFSNEFSNYVKSDPSSALVIARHFLNSLFRLPNEDNFIRLSEASQKLFKDKRLVKNYFFSDSVNILKSAMADNVSFVVSRVFKEFSDQEISSNPVFFNNILTPVIVSNTISGFMPYYDNLKTKAKIISKQTLDLSYSNNFQGHAMLMELSEFSTASVDSYQDNYLQKSIIDQKKETSNAIVSKKAVDLNYKNSLSNNALILACQKGDIELVALLLNNGADPNSKCQGGYTPLMVVVKKQNTTLAKLLIEKNADVAIKNDESLNCYDMIEANRKYANSKQMINILKGKK